MKLARPLLRSILMVALSAGLLAGVGGAILAPQAVAVTTVKTTANVNVRSGPGTTYSILGVIASGTTLATLGPSSNGWTPISYSGRTAYLYSYYLTVVSTSTPTPTPTATSTAVKIVGTGTAIEDLNVRTGPGTTYSVVTVAPKGTVFNLTGKASNGFHEVVYSGSLRWVSDAWIIIKLTVTTSPSPTATASASGTAAASATSSASSTATSTASSTATSSASSTASSTSSSTSSSSATASATSTASPTATSSATTATDCTNLPAVKGQVRATAALMIRTTSDSTFVNLGDVPAGTILDVTGVVTNGVAQIVYKCAVRWVNALYIAALVPNLPAYLIGDITVVGQRYALVALNVYTSSTGTAVEDLVPRGILLPITGNTGNLRSEIVWNGARRWVVAASLSTMAPSAATDASVGLDGLSPNAAKIVADVRTRFTAIFTIYGIRPDTYPDHPSGHAVDLMLPLPYLDPASQLVGQTIANYYRANAVKFGIQYIIWHQYIWNIERDSEGWRYMADRGSDTANHINHVHITVY